MSKRAKIAREWRALAQRIASGQWSYGGLCEEVDALEDIDTRAAMSKQLSKHLQETPCGCDDCESRREVGPAAWIDEPGRPEARVLACLMLALEAEDAARSI
jgi:hypothetical protein